MAKLLIERHRLEPSERRPVIGTHYMLGLLRSGLARVEAFDRQSSGKRHAKRAGAVTQAPPEPGPSIVFHDTAKTTICAFSKCFMEDVAAGLDHDLSHALPGTEGQKTVSDTTIVRLIALLDEEAVSGGESGLLYAESLARALALRSLLLSNPNSELVQSAKKSVGGLSG